MSGMMICDNTAFELISNAAQERLKYLLEQVKLVAQHRIDISMKVELDFYFYYKSILKYYLE